MKHLASLLGGALAVLTVSWFVMLLAGSIYALSYKQTLSALCILYLLAALLRKAD